MKNYYLLPLLSISLFILFLLGGNITGLVTLNQKEIQANIILTTTEDDVLPGEAIITMTIADYSASKTIKEFITITQQPYTERYGQLKQINYTGQGYSGEHTYTLPLTTFNPPTNLATGTYQLTTTITYKETTISTNTEEITIQ
ncbi:MAG: hypothetical protein Q7R96_00595 [Nanoarchaeota archaeon]|nr:hypothetical protein [Nanoarchaeota archaeon]